MLDDGGPYPVCEDQNWTHIITGLGWTPAAGLNCEYMKSGWSMVNGSSVDWTLAPGSGPATLPVSCDLNADRRPPVLPCSDLFWANVERYIMPMDGAGPIEPETRGADFLASDTGNMVGVIRVDPQASPTTYPNDMQPLLGIAEYSAVDCGEDGCPFYLGNVFAYGPNIWEVELEVDDGQGGSVALPKELHDVQIDLLQSVMGVRRMSDGVVAFDEGTVHMEMTFTIDSCSSCDPTGDGTYTVHLENDEVLFGTFDPIMTFTGGHWSPGFGMMLEFPFQGGYIEVNAWFEPDEHPPEAAHSLPASRRCNDPDGYLLPSSALDSDDPDADLEYQIWIVDGEPYDPAVPLPVGEHSVGVEAWDSRGAVHRSEPTSFTVTQSSIVCP